MRSDGDTVETLRHVLAGSWRRDLPPRPTLSTHDAAIVAPLLIGAGAAGLGWRSLSRSTEFAQCPSLDRLRDACRHLLIRDALKERMLEFAVAKLNAVGVTPMLFKGWASARHYAESYLRPYDDFDLLVREGDLEKSRLALARSDAPSQRPDNKIFPLEAPAGWGPLVVDLHCPLSAIYRSPTELLFERGTPRRLGEAQFLIPSPEDHLRILIIHFLKHGGWRPLWLCDVGAAVEAASDDFDWDLCATSDPVVMSWVRATIAAAAQLLGCRTERLPAPMRAELYPHIRRTLEREWRRPFPERHLAPNKTILWSHLPQKLRTYWNNGLAAAILADIPAEKANLLPEQLAFFESSLRLALAKAQASLRRPLSQPIGQSLRRH